MLSEIILSETHPEHAAAIAAIHDAAFKGVDESRLVREMTADGDAALSLGAFSGGELVGHAFWFRCTLQTPARDIPIVGLGPIGVRPDVQRLGVGGALIREGRERLTTQGETLVLVLGHPSYYPRFGFSADLAKTIEAPWRGPSFMALPLSVTAPTGGRAIYPKAFGV